MKPTKRILLVEDDPADAKLVQIILEDCGYGEELHVAADGVIALDYLLRRHEFADRSEGHPALLLLDLKLPRLDGFETLQAVRAESDLHAIPVVILTSSNQKSDVARAYALGANAYVIKGSGYDDHAATVSMLVGFWLQVNEPPPGCLHPT